jgi:dihydrofolate reductase
VPGDDILVFGSATLVESLMDADLTDEYRLLVHPIIMGSGKRAFKDGMATTTLKLRENHNVELGGYFALLRASKELANMTTKETEIALQPGTEMGNWRALLRHR